MFNKSQIQAVSHNKGPAIVLAGPGSGKTTVITHRIKNLIDNMKVPPEKILVVTFTKAAAVHMREKFLAIMESEWGRHKSCPVTFGTFHSVYYRILRLTYNYKKDNILSEVMKIDIIKEIIIRMKIDVKSVQDFVQDISGEIGRVKGNMLDVDTYIPGCCKKEIFFEVFKEYERALESERKIDFEDMLLRCYELLKERKDVLEKWQLFFEYILIDEFQDINRVQYEIIKLLALPQNNIFIVGDDDQSIYGFRGACPEIMFQFSTDYNEAQKYFLSINYRSVSEIVKASQNLIKHNKDRFEKDIVSSGESGLYPDIRQFTNQGEELKHMCTKINKYIKDGMNFDEIAILVRNNSQINGIVSTLKNEGIQVHRTIKYNGVYQGMVARDVIGYVKAALNKEISPLKDNENLIYILNRPARLISRRIVVQDNMNFKNLKLIYQHSREILGNIEQLEFHLKIISTLNPYAALVYIRNGVGYEEYLRQYGIENKIKIADLMKQLDEIQNDAVRFDTLRDWIGYADSRLMETNISLKGTKEGNGVNVITMHGAKGLEFKAVFIVDANQGIIPSSRAVRERDFQEERRIFYVAMTRASEFLNIYCSAESLGCPIENSMFVDEIMESGNNKNNYRNR